MKELESGAYWEQACHFFRGSGFAGSEGAYFVHNKNGEYVKIGILCQRVVFVGDSNFRHAEDGRSATVSLQPNDTVFTRVEKRLRKDAPCFFLVSPDVFRRFSDKGLPQALFVQPMIEFVFSPDGSQGRISYAQDPVSERRGDALLRTFWQSPPSVPPNDPGGPRSFAEVASGWTSPEDDDGFLRRLNNAIGVLQAFPDGKMTLTRAYERRLAAKLSPFRLYELHARTNGDYACSHYFCIRRDVISLGATPENVLEVSDRTLTVDVVAATCKSSGDDEYLANELYKKPKQIKEHQSSLNNRQNRFVPFCKADSLRVVQDMKIKKLRNVCHLYSVFVSELLHDVTVFDLIGNLFPLLGARPRELLAVADTEAAPHRYYGGIVGHLHLESGGCFLNIRNALLDGSVIHAKVGTGVIKESNSCSELLETKDKLSGVLEAVYLWEKSGSH